MKTYFIQTFWCQMNEADSEKVNMMLLQSGFMKVPSWEKADLVIFNTCSVRKKGEDRVYSMMNELKKDFKKSGKKIVTGITGCMVRKTGMHKMYLPQDAQREAVTKIEYIQNTEGIFNNDDKLFPKVENLDFTLRIEEIQYLPFILTHIYGEKIGQEDKFSDYLKTKQQRENPYSASVIIQTGCDNYCTFCIVPFTRGKETSRPIDEIVAECREAVQSGAKEITLLGQNVNSYGKQFVDRKLWNTQTGKWNLNTKLKIGIDIDDSLIFCWEKEILENYTKKTGKVLQFDEILTHNFNDDRDLEEAFYDFFNNKQHELKLFPDADSVLKDLKDAGHELYVVTSREPNDMRHHTHDLLDKYFGKDFFHEICFIKDTGEDKKYKAAEKFNLDVVIEDALHHIQDYVEHGNVKVIMYDMPWNRGYTEDNSRTFRAKSWREVEAYVQSLLPRENKTTFVSPFRQLLNELNKIEWLDRIRFTSSNPHDMTQDILDAHFELPKLCNYLHFALQSGSNEMLKRMNRKHTYEDFKKIVDYLRSKDPLFSISTDMIVGFSGETDEMFLETLKAFDECQFDFAYNARYSVRPQTLAAKIYPDDVPNTVKAERWHQINAKLEECVEKRNSLLIGKVEEVMINGERDEQWFGRTRNFKEVFFDKQTTTPELVEGESSMSEGHWYVKIGDIVKVKITQLDRWVLKGERV